MSVPPDERPTVSVIAPMYNEGGNVERFVAAVEATLGEHRQAYEIVLVDDGSQDDTWSRISGEAARNPRVRGLLLSRNFGHQNALFAGLHHARGEAIISMDGDLQHPPAVIPRLLEAWRGGYQVVTTIRQDGPDTPWFKRATSRWFYGAFSWLSGVPLSAGSSDFRLVDARALRAILEMRDPDLFLRGMVSWVGFRSTRIPFEADPRLAGNTKYTIAEMWRLATGAMMSFSMLPLKMGIWLGFLTGLFALAQVVFTVVHYFRGNTVPGWATVVVLMSLMFAVLFALLGVIGLYLSKIFEILKGRQRFIVREYAGFGDARRGAE